MRLVTSKPRNPHRLGELAVLSAADVAELSGFSLKTVLRAIRAGELVASKVRNTYRVWPADYRAWIDGARVARSPSVPVPESVGSVIGSATRLRELEPEL